MSRVGRSDPGHGAWPWHYIGCRYARASTPSAAAKHSQHPRTGICSCWVLAKPEEPSSIRLALKIQKSLERSSPAPLQSPDDSSGDRDPAVCAKLSI